MTADDLVGKTGVAGGLVSFPRAVTSDEALAFDLAKRPAFVTHLMAQDVKVVESLRDRAEAAGLLGRSLYVEQGQPVPMPFADRLADMIVVTDLRDGDLTPELRDAWLRALAPRRGAALLGREKSAGGGLSKNALAAWVKDLPLAKVVADDSGVWAVLRTDLPAGSDSWTHRLHGPENSQVSGDTTLKAPFLTQWLGMPRQEGFWGTTLASGNGRLFTIRSHRYSFDRGATDPEMLTARSLTSGMVLWQRRMLQATPGNPETFVGRDGALVKMEGDKVPHDGYLAGRSCIAVAGDVLYLADGDGVLRLNAETGAGLGRIAGPKAAGQIKWMACDGSLLAMLAGEKDVLRETFGGQLAANNPSGRELAACEAATGRELWRDTLANDVDERQIALGRDRLFYLAGGIGLVCREARSGKTVWTEPVTNLVEEFKTPSTDLLSKYETLYSVPTLMALNEVLLLRAVWTKKKEVVAVSRDSGKVMWRAPTAFGAFGRALIGCAVNGLWLGGNAPIDLKTGKRAAGPKFIAAGCGPTTSTPNYLITPFGAVSDIVTGRLLRPDDLRTPCDAGTIVSEGLLVTAPAQCGCNFEQKGYRALASAGDVKPHVAAAWQERLDSRQKNDPPPLPITDADWPTYRHDSGRSAGSPASIGGSPKVLWQWKPAGSTAYSNVVASAKGPRLAPDFVATAPVAAAGFVWFGSHDGVVRCLRADNGKEVWKFPAGGMLFAPPTIWEGRVFVGGGDGVVYCLDASSGQCLWKFRAAPTERKMFWFGHLVSTWPIITGVVVHDGVAYAVAGHLAENGIHAYALNPKTGAVLWERHDAGLGGEGNPESALSSGGHAAIGAGRLWLCSYNVIPGSFDLKSGEWKPILSNRSWQPFGRDSARFGSEIAVLDGKWAILGGRRLSETQDTVLRPMKAGTETMVWSAQMPTGQTARAGLNMAAPMLPSWDADAVMLPPHEARGEVVSVPAAGMDEWLASVLSGEAHAGSRARGLREIQTWTSDRKAGMWPVACVLAKDQLVVAHKTGYEVGVGNKVSGFNRTDGALAWAVELPDQPAMGRMALDREGRVLVSLCDGSVVCLGR
jgi:outer membrane protein assembly factor BamB